MGTTTITATLKAVELDYDHVQFATFIVKHGGQRAELSEWITDEGKAERIDSRILTNAMGEVERLGLALPHNGGPATELYDALDAALAVATDIE